MADRAEAASLAEGMFGNGGECIVADEIVAHLARTLQVFERSVEWNAFAALHVEGEERPSLRAGQG